jgi:hypothetical protein
MSKINYLKILLGEPNFKKCIYLVNHYRRGVYIGGGGEIIDMHTSRLDAPPPSYNKVE